MSDTAPSFAREKLPAADLIVSRRAFGLYWRSANRERIALLTPPEIAALEATHWSAMQQAAAVDARPAGPQRPAHEATPTP